MNEILKNCLMILGGIVGGDSLSENMGKHSSPIQLVWGVNETRVSTFFYAVDLNEKGK